MRVLDVEIEAPSDDVKWTKSQKAAYGKRSLPDILKELAENGATSASTYTRIPITYRAPTIDLPIENPTPYDLFSIFISPEMLDQVSLYTNQRGFSGEIATRCRSTPVPV